MKFEPGIPPQDALQQATNKWAESQKRAAKISFTLTGDRFERWYELLCLVRRNPTAKYADDTLCTVLREMQAIMWSDSPSPQHNEQP